MDSAAASTDPAGSIPDAPGDGETGEEPGGTIVGLGIDGEDGELSNACFGDAGSCPPPLRDVDSAACIPTGPRDCSSDLDNDCDGQPDDVVDDVCVCAPGSVEPCDEHPGLDGSGPCRAGLRTCIIGADELTSEWGACEGSVGPGEADSCAVRGDDSDCNGTPNTDCPCVDGDTQQCGSTTDIGVCAFGTSTCVGGRFGACIGAVPPAAQDSCAPGDDSNCNGRANDRFCACLDGATQECGVTGTGACELGIRTCINGTFGQCVGAVNPASRDCRSQQDIDCDGRPDNTRDNICRCFTGETAVCGEHPGLDGIGRCRAGTQQCVVSANSSSSNFGSCIGSQGPLARDCRSQQDNDCDGRPDNTRDSVCECIPGQGNGPCSGDPNNSRCNGQGQCVPCQSTADCSLVSGGRNTCDDGRCIQGDVAAPVLLNTGTPVCNATGATVFELLFFLATDNTTQPEDIEYAVYYANPGEPGVPSGATSAAEVLRLADQGILVQGRAFSPVTGGTFDGRIVVALAGAEPVVEARIVVRDEAGNMTAYPPCRVAF